MATVSKTKTWADNEVVNYSDLNANFDTLYNLVNGNLNGDNVDTTVVTTLTGTQTLTNKTLTTPTLTSPVLNTGVSGTAVLDEDDLASDSATKLATQQSIKAYVDAKTRTRSLWLPASVFDSATGSPTQADQDDVLQYWGLPDAASSGISASFLVPDDYVSGDLTAYIYWFASSATTGDCRFIIRSTDNLAESALIGASYNQTLEDTTDGTVLNLNITAGTAFTNGTALAAGQVRGIGIKRDGTAGEDTLSDTAKVIGVRITYTGY